MTRFTRLPLSLFAVAFALLLAVTGCSSAGADSAADIDPDTAAQALLQQVAFRDTLVKAEDGAAENYYRLDDSIASYAIYISGSGATAEEIAVLQAVDSTRLADAEAIVNKRVETLKIQFENYVPEEMVKLADPVIVSRGDVVVLVLADDRAEADQAVAALFD